MDERIVEVLSALERRSLAEQAELDALRAAGGSALREAAHRFMLDVGRETGLLLNMLVRCSNARVVVEVGGSVGYSTLWLAEAARANGGKVLSFETNAQKRKEQRENLEAAGLAGVVDQIADEPPAVIPSLEGPLDFVFLDHWKELYVRELDLCWPKLRPGGLVAADNIVVPAKNAEQIRAYLARVRGLPGARTTTLPVGSGLEITLRLAPPHEHPDPKAQAPTTGGTSGTP